MACQSSVSWACGWLVSAVFWSWLEKALISRTVFETKNEMRVHVWLGSTCNAFRVRVVIVRMPYLPLRKVRWDNSICVAQLRTHCLTLTRSTWICTSWHWQTSVYLSHWPWSLPDVGECRNSEENEPIDFWTKFLLGQSFSTILSHLQPLWNLQLRHFGPDTWRRL